MEQAAPILSNAIAIAKRSQSAEVEPDHVLAACLLSVSLFGIARLANLVIDLESLGIDWMQDPAAGAYPQIKVAYSADTVALLDRASAISRAGNASPMRIAHLLAAFSLSQPQGLMATLAQKHGIDSAAWRAALADFDSVPGVAHPGPATAGTYVSPEQAAEILGVHHQTIRGYIRSGKLPALRIAGERAVRIRRESLDRLLEPAAG